jgi:hypothetical protein
MGPRPPARTIPPRARGASEADVAVLLLGLGTLAALKGLTLSVDHTVAYLYYTDYRFGYVARGLIGQLFSPVLAATPKAAHAGILVAWHLATLAALLVALARLAARTVAAAGTGRREVVLAAAVLLFCSPLLTSLASLPAAPEVLLCLLTLGVAEAVRAGRYGLAWLAFLVGALAHQLIIFVALPVMVLGGLLDADRRRFAVAGSVLAGAAACLAVLLAPAPDARFVGVFVEHGIPPGAARSLFEDQLGQTTGRMLGAMAELWRRHPLNGAVAVAYGASAGAAILAACLLSPGAARAAAEPLAFLPRGWPRSVLAVLLVAGAGLGPLLVLAFAWDLSRLAVLATFTSFLAADTALRRVPRDDPAAAAAPRAPSSRSAAVALGCGALAAVFLCLPYVGLWFNGALVKREELVVPNPVLEVGATRAVVEGFLRFYNRDAP